ncbi:MAG: glycosyltransferase family 2 protein [Cyanobacteriota bacterium]
MLEPKVSIIVPIHNSLNYTLKFLESIKKVNYTNYEIIIVDDGSTDGSYEKISELYPNIILLRGDGDYWWTKSINTGIKYALKNNPDFILTLNNDVEVDKDIITNLIKCYNNNPDSIIGSKVYKKSTIEEVFFGGGKISWLIPSHFNIAPYGNLDNEPYSKVREVDFLTGMGCLFHAKMFHAIGFLNEEKLPQYYADGEITLRAKKTGYKLLFCPEAKLWNCVESTSWYFPDKFNLANLKKLLYHKGSPYYIKATSYMYFHYWPKTIGWLAFTLLYFKCFIGLILKEIPGGSKIINLFRQK